MGVSTPTKKASSRARPHAVLDGAGEIVQHIRDGDACTTSGLATVMGMARSTVLQRLEVLTEHHLISQEKLATQIRGRPATRWVFNPSAGHVLAAHVGLSGCRIAATDLAGTVLHQSFFDVDLAAGPDGLLQDLVESFDAVTSNANLDSTQLVGIGLGMPRGSELLAYLHSVGLTGTRWDHGYVKQNLHDRYEVPVFVDTDVNLLALAERNRTSTDAEAFVCVKVGTIIDAAIVINGTPLRGATQLASELAHIKVQDSQEPCTCGSSGCLDAVASGAALVQQLQAAGCDIHHPSDVAQKANDGTPQAIRAVRTAGRHIGEVLSTVVNLLNPDVITLWGYLTNAEAILFAGIREGLYPNALPDSTQQLTLTSAALGDLAGVHGAANLVIDELLQPQELDQKLAAGASLSDPAQL